jgi:dihydroorotate dehydrogenase (fumarate)
MDISVMLAGQKFSVPIMNGAGSCKTLEDVRSLARTPAGGIVVGSGTVKGGTGNENNTFDWNQYRSLNSLDLPNPGKEVYRSQLPEMVNIATQAGKPLHFSIAGNTPDEYAEMALVALEAKVNCLEINLGCPNKFDGDKRQARIIANLPYVSYEILHLIRRRIGFLLPISVKVTYYSDRGVLEEMAGVINDPRFAIHAVVTTNTLPNCVAFTENGKHLLVPQFKGYAGGGGRMMKEAGLGQVQMWRETLKPEIQIIGVGGISTGRDVVEYMWAGADAVQMTTALLTKGRLDPQPLERVTLEFADQAHLVSRFASTSAE